MHTFVDSVSVTLLQSGQSCSMLFYRPNWSLTGAWPGMFVQRVQYIKYHTIFAMIQARKRHQLGTKYLRIFASESITDH